MAKSETLTHTRSLNWHRPINVAAAGWAGSAVLVVVFVVCLIAALLYPSAPLAHNWVSLFSVAPLNSGLVWFEGIVASVAFAWIAAAVGGLIYNRFAQ